MASLLTLLLLCFSGISYALDYQTVLKTHNQSRVSSSEYGFDGTVLGYVTPWNPSGYDTAMQHMPSGAIISPVSFTIKPSKPSDSVVKYIVEGDVDAERMQQARKEKIRICPRFMFEAADQNDFVTLLQQPENWVQLARAIVDKVRENSFDGVVFEVGPVQYFVDVVYEVSSMLKREYREDVLFILVIPPASKTPETPITRDFIRNLQSVVDYFSLMTYDYSSIAQKASANAPIPWIQTELDALCGNGDCSHILMGINFYGYDFSSVEVKPIVGREYLELLATHKPALKWESNSKEHFFEYTSKHEGKTVKSQVWYPSQESIRERVELAKKFGVGIAIWELGQGLVYFWDAFE